MKKYNFFEFKSPLDKPQREDYSKLVGYAMQYHALNMNFAISDVSLFLVAPVWNANFEEGLRLWQIERTEVEPGVHQLKGPTWQSWMIETDVVSQQLGNEVLGLFSENFMKDPTQWVRNENLPPWFPVWMSQQMAAYRKRSYHMPLLHAKEFEEKMKEALADYLNSLPNEQLQNVLGKLSAEERLKDMPAEVRLKGVSAEERLKGVPAEERLKDLPVKEILRALSTEDRLKNLSAEEREQLKKLLE